MVNYIAIYRENYELFCEWENAIHNTVRILIENNYVIRMELQDFGMMIIEYDHRDYELSDRRCVWLTDTELDTVVYDDEKAGKIDE